MLDALVAEARLRWGLDPATGLQVFAAESLLGAPIEPSRPVLIVPLATLRADAATDVAAPLPGRAGPSGRDPLALLARLYPADHPVGRFGADDGATVGALTASSLETPIYLSPVAPELAIAGPWAMPWISNRLRQPDGCPWDREQTHQSLRKHLLEESYEAISAIDSGDFADMREEFGDLLLQVVLQSQIAHEEGQFNVNQVIHGIHSKIVRRHPHVFGDLKLDGVDGVLANWEKLKAKERSDKKQEKGLLDGIPLALPALSQAQEYQDRAARVGFDWPEIEGVLDKVKEEIA